MHAKKIIATLQKGSRGIEEEIQIPVLSILAVSEEWDWRQERHPDGTLGPKRHVYLGTRISSHRSHGWLVKEREKEIEARIDFQAKHNKHYLGECNCWGTREKPVPCAGSMYAFERKKRSA